ncbi:unnamed protein product [Lactuca saligna]|uniref:Uncharacterized protein n=1 Tax=Lactuca saligna TaxID=75948 RepID=A0AA35YU56_LACSI|nr:unnamed protein product [Lactuca saligna]
MYDFTYVENVAHAHVCAERAPASDGCLLYNKYETNKVLGVYVTYSCRAWERKKLRHHSSTVQMPLGITMAAEKRCRLIEEVSNVANQLAEVFLNDEPISASVLELEVSIIIQSLSFLDHGLRHLQLHNLIS